MVAVNRRFNPLLTQAREMVEEKGRIAVIVAEFYHFSIPLYPLDRVRRRRAWRRSSPRVDPPVDLIRYLGGDVARSTPGPTATSTGITTASPR